MKDEYGIDICPACGNVQDEEGVCEWCGHKEIKSNK